MIVFAGRKRQEIVYCMHVRVCDAKYVYSVHSELLRNDQNTQIYSRIESRRPTASLSHEMKPQTNCWLCHIRQISRQTTVILQQRKQTPRHTHRIQIDPECDLLRWSHSGKLLKCTQRCRDCKNVRTCTGGAFMSWRLRDVKQSLEVALLLASRTNSQAEVRRAITKKAINATSAHADVTRARMRR